MLRVLLLFLLLLLSRCCGSPALLAPLQAVVRVPGVLAVRVTDLRKTQEAIDARQNRLLKEAVPGEMEGGARTECSRPFGLLSSFGQKRQNAECFVAFFDFQNNVY